MDFIKDFCKVLVAIEDGVKTFRTEVEKNGELFEVLIKRQATEFKQKAAKQESPKKEEKKPQETSKKEDVAEEFVYGDLLKEAINKAFEG